MEEDPRRGQREAVPGSHPAPGRLARHEEDPEGGVQGADEAEGDGEEEARAGGGNRTREATPHRVAAT